MRAARLKRSGPRFVVCVNNAGYEVSLELHKIYAAIPDADAEQSGDVRIIDESGEDYLYSMDRFVAIEIPPALRKSILKKAS